MTFDRKTFFDGYRAAFGSLNNSQVEGLEFLLGKLESDTFSLKQIAYILATIHHETGVRRNGELQTFQPIKELRGKVGTKIRKTQDRYWGTGYFGRGYVQITWEDNYKKFGIADDPDKALEPETAYEIVSRGMREGVFTGKRLSHYINGTADYYNARKIINGTDKAEEIAAKAVAYESILKRSVLAASLVIEKSADKDVTAEPSKAPDGAVTTVSGVPPSTEVKPSGMSLPTKIGAAAGPVVTAAGALGIKFGGIQITQGTIFALCGLGAVAVICSTIIYITGKNREWERQKLSMMNLADPNRGNVVAGK